ncbi:F type H transporting ATPase subunit e [Schistosoma japonicum]|nr:F type H transporting ATPase subunit e [Schistosoma japonicum]
MEIDSLFLDYTTSHPKKYPICIIFSSRPVGSQKFYLGFGIISSPCTSFKQGENGLLVQPGRQQLSMLNASVRRSKQVELMEDSMYVKKLPAPREVSPLIRTARWGLLVAGIVYGALRLSYLTKREKKISEHDRAVIEKRLTEYNEWVALQKEKSLREATEAIGLPSLD